MERATGECRPGVAREILRVARGAVGAVNGAALRGLCGGVAPGGCVREARSEYHRAEHDGKRNGEELRGEHKIFFPGLRQAS